MLPPSAAVQVLTRGNGNQRAEGHWRRREVSAGQVGGFASGRCPCAVRPRTRAPGDLRRRSRAASKPAWRNEHALPAVWRAGRERIACADCAAGAYSGGASWASRSAMRLSWNRRFSRAALSFSSRVRLPVPLEYSIEWLTCAFANRLDVVMVSLADAAQDRVLAYMQGALPGRPGVPRRPGEGC